MQVVFYSFNKRPNSTKRPTGGTACSVTLKSAESIRRPSILLEGEKELSWNYCYIPVFARYYFVSDITLEANSLWRYTLEEDYLATWKDSILASSCYVQRSATQGVYSEFIKDSTWTLSQRWDEDVYSANLSNIDGDGCYILSVVNSVSNGVGSGGVTMYALTPSVFRNLVNRFFTPSVYGDPTTKDSTTTKDSSGAIVDTSETTRKLLDIFTFNPFQYVTSCLYVPIAISNIQGTLQVIQFGWWSSGISGKAITNSGQYINGSIQCGVFESWIDRDPAASNYSIFLPGAGLNQIDSAMAGNTITIRGYLDYRTGEILYRLEAGDNALNIATFSGQLGVPIPLASLAVNAKNVTAPSTVVGLARGVAEDIGEAFRQMSTPEGWLGSYADSAIPKNLYGAMQPTPCFNGSAGNFFNSAVNLDCKLYARKLAVLDKSPEVFGGMVNEVKALSELSGFTKCVNAAIDMPGYGEEKAVVKSFMEGGFFIE